MSLVHEKRKNQEKYKTDRLQAVEILSDIIFVGRCYFDETVFSIVLSTICS